MKLVKIIAKNYKAFPSLELSLKDFNIVIGKNGAGKSSILRLIPLIVDSILIDDDRIISLNPYNLDFAANYQDIVFGNSIGKPLSLGLTFSHDGTEHTFITEIIYSSDTLKIIPVSFWYKVDNEELFFRNLMGEEDIFKLNDEIEIKIPFKGLLPNIEKINDSTLSKKIGALEILRKELASNYLSYIGPFRRKMERVYAKKFELTTNVGIEGEFTPQILFNQDAKIEFELINKINKWMRKHLEKTSLELLKDSSSFSINIKKNNISTNIVDHGVGFSQLLPLITSKFCRSLSENFGMEIVEQAELHLHPAMCGSIIDLYLSEFNISDTIILETHSKEIIFRLRRRIAEDKDKVLMNKSQLIFVDQNEDGSSISYINFLEDGSCSWWPDGVFEESYEDIIAIEEAVNGN